MLLFSVEYKLSMSLIYPIFMGYLNQNFDLCRRSLFLYIRRLTRKIFQMN